jgi:hypothetical protein
MFDVGDPIRNAVLTGCFVGIAALTVVTLLPWTSLGAARIGRWARWAIVPMALLAVAYEAAMPSRFDIRVDLLLLLPMYGLAVAASIVRWVRSRGAPSP